VPTQGTVLVVASDPDALERLGKGLEDAGFEVMACRGPITPDYACIGGREGYCPLVECADVVVLDPWLAGDEYGVGTTADQLVEVYVGSGRAVVLLGSVGWLDPFLGGPVISIGERAETSDVVAAVRSAPEASKFVLRRT
jgi:hypothetical protein